MATIGTIDVDVVVRERKARSAWLTGGEGWLFAAVALVIAAVLVFTPAVPDLTNPTRAAINEGRTTPMAVVVPQVFTSPTGHGTAIPLGSALYLTAAHVVRDRSEVAIGLNRTDAVPARVMWVAMGSDLALLHAPSLRSEGIPVRCHDGRIGEEVKLRGYPFGIGYTESQGRIVGRRSERFDPKRENITYENGVQWHDAASGPGVSGGPVLDAYGRLLGVAVLGWGPYGGIVPASEVCRALGRS